MEYINIMVFIWRSSKEWLLHTWWFIYACMFFAMLLRLRATSHRVPSPKSQVWHGCLHGNNFGGQRLGSCTCCTWAYGRTWSCIMCWKLKNWLRHKLWRDALWREGGGQLWKCPWGSHHQALRPHPLYNLHDQVRVWWRLSHCLKLLLLQQRDLNFATSFHRGGSLSEF
jgi:hypothetical protein